MQDSLTPQDRPSSSPSQTNQHTPSYPSPSLQPYPVHRRHGEPTDRPGPGGQRVGVPGSPSTTPEIGFSDPTQEITYATAGIHRGARERGGVAGGGAGATGRARPA